MENSITISQVEQINRMILALYDNCQPFHTRITNFFHSMLDLMYFDKASLMFFYQDAEGHYHKQSSITMNWDAALLEAYDRALYKLDDTLAPVDQPHHVLLRSSSYFHGGTRQQTAFWTEYQQPSNADYEIFGNVLTDDTGGLRCKLCFARSEEDFTVSDLWLIRQFQPHLSQIAKLYLHQCGSPAGAVDLENYNCIGYCILDGADQVTKSNEMFRHLNQRVDGKLLRKLTELCRTIPYEPHSVPQVISLEYKLDDEPLFLEIIQTTSVKGKTQYNCMVYDLSHFFNSTMLQIKDRYQLTDREYEIFAYILKGLRNEEIAQKLYLSIPSVKKYIASIFEKMGISNQKQVFSCLKMS